MAIRTIRAHGAAPIPLPATLPRSLPRVAAGVLFAFGLALPGALRAQEEAAPGAPVRPAAPSPAEPAASAVPGPEKSPPARSVATVPAAVAAALEEGARTEGAWGLVKALERVLEADPSLVATPPRAAALAAVAGRLVTPLDDAEGVHREAVEVLILAYAPPSQRADVAARVAQVLRPPRPAPAAVEDGLRLGSFRLHPTLFVSEVFDDDIFATRVEEQDDFITHVSPSFLLRSAWKRHGLSFDGGGDFSFYDDNESEDTQDAWLGTDAHLDLTASTILFGGARFARDHEDRASPDEVNGEEPTLFYETDGYLGLEQRVGRFSFRLGGTADRLDFRDVPALVGELNNDDRDRLMTTGGLRVGYRLGRGRTELFAQAAYDDRRYDSTRDDAGFDRDSHGLRVLAGVAFAPRSDLWLAVFGGYLEQDYDDPLLDDVDAPTFGAEIEWSPLTDTWITLFVDRFLDETTLTGASSDLVTRVGATLEHTIWDGVDGTLTFSYAEDDYRGISRTDEVYYAGAGLRIDVGRHLYVVPEYRFVHRDSNVFEEDYTRSQVWLALGMDFPVPGVPRRRTRALRALAPPPGAGLAGVPFPLDGPYLGAQAGHGALLTVLEGPRSGGASVLQAPFGAHGGTAGIFAGWGETWGRFYLGLEAEGEFGEADWEHENRQERVFSLRKTWGWAAELRAGVVLRESSLFYVRGGPAWSRFELDYRLALDDIDDVEEERGYRVGVGLEAPIASWLFLRADHAYSDYGKLDVEYTTGVDRLELSETLTRLGIGMRFSGLFRGSDAPEPRAVPVDWNGPYVGAFASHGVLVTQVTGVREATNPYDADFADHGVAGGLFVGFGHAWDGWYLGAEVGGEASRIDWSHDRSVTGREFAVEEDYTLDASLRVGRVLHDTALFYLKGGGARTRFRSTYLQGPVFVDQNDFRGGWRFGAGLEVAASERTFVRLEYDYTRYSDYEVDFESNVDEFDPSASRTRLALGVRF